MKPRAGLSYFTDAYRPGAIDHASIQVTVLDEADHMADLSFLPAVTRILDETPTDGLNGWARAAAKVPRRAGNRPWHNLVVI